MNTRKCITDIGAAVKLYLTCDRLGTAEIIKLFGCSSATAVKFKKLALEQEKKDGLLPPSRYTVNTASAFKAWGININELKRRVAEYEKLKGALA